MTSATRGLPRPRPALELRAVLGADARNTGWEWIFFINIPFGLAALVLSPRLLSESRATLARRSYDPAGALTITGALVLLVYALVDAPDVGWGDVQTSSFSPARPCCLLPSC